MATASISSTPGASYTWATYANTWASADAQALSWATAQPNAWTCSITEDTVTTSEAIGKDVTLSTFAESWSNVETSFVKSYGLNPSESVTTTESLPAFSFGQTLSESVLFSETIGKDITVGTFSESWSNTETSFVKSYGLNPSETITTSESLPIFQYSQALIESVGVTEGISKDITLSTFSEAWTQSEAIGKDIGQNSFETITTVEDSVPSPPFTWLTYGNTWASIDASLVTWANAQANPWSTSSSESVSFTEAVGKDIGLISLTESWSQTESISKSVGYNPSEFWTVTDIAIAGMVWDRQLSETISFTESTNKDVTLTPFLESWSQVESYNKGIGLNPSESVTTTEVFDRTATFDRQLSETTTFSEALSNGMSIAKSDSWTFTDSNAANKDIGGNYSESFSTSDSNKFDFGQYLAESMTVTEVRSSNFSKPITEIAFSVSDEIRSKAKGVVSDVLLSNTDLTFADFSNLLANGMPTGYSQFNSYMNGDYSYKNAMFKVAFSTDNVVSSTRLTALQVQMDVPDLFDGGQATVSATGTTITFNKTFAIAPEINCALKGGTVFAIPKISNITKTSFLVELYDATNTRVAGSITWAAHGY